MEIISCKTCCLALKKEQLHLHLFNYSFLLLKSTPGISDSLVFPVLLLLIVLNRGFEKQNKSNMKLKIGLLKYSLACPIKELHECIKNSVQTKILSVKLGSIYSISSCISNTAFFMCTTFRYDIHWKICSSRS